MVDDVPLFKIVEPQRATPRHDQAGRAGEHTAGTAHGRHVGPVVATQGVLIENRLARVQVVGGRQMGDAVDQDGGTLLELGHLP